jgi:drug/metabolite transporter (DMT)-like permease
LTVAFTVGLVCAVVSAFGTNLSFLYKHRGAVAAPDVDIRKPLRSAIDLFRSKWWTIGWAVAVVAFGAHVAALALLPLSLAQSVLSGGFVLLAVLAERYFGFDLGRRQWFGVVLVAVSLALIGVTDMGGGSNSQYSIAGMILFEGGALALGLLFVFSHRVPRLRGQRGVLLGAAAGIGFGISDVAVKALSGDLDSGLPGLVSAWSVLIVLAGIGAFFASARSLQIGEGVSVIAVTSVAANLSAILAGVLVFGDPLGEDALVVIARVTAFVLVLVAAGLMPAPVRAGEAMKKSSSADEGSRSPSPA